MEAAIDANAPLDYVEFTVFPSQNRYEACACYANKKDKVMSGLLEHLVLHSAEIKALRLKGSNAKFRLSSPSEIANDNKWFTKSTLIRFLHIIGSANIFEVTNSLKNEISQLEEACKFHLSLHKKNVKSRLESAESDGNYSSGDEAMKAAEGSDASKNNLLQAIDSRLTALRGELTAAFDQAAGSRYSVGLIIDIEKFSRHIGSESFSESLHKYIELREGTGAVENSTHNVPESERVRSKEVNNCTSELFSSDMPVRYGVSPAKAAQVERQSLTESDESSFSSEEERPSAERSRTLARSASPRRSASPMRRVQIGRSGSRRATAITIKSLNFVPARERSFLPRDLDASDDDEQGSQNAPKQSENNVRISVQDAISLFERKQRDQTTDVQKARSMLNASIGPNKSVLRRWSSGMSESSSRCPQDVSTDDSVAEMQRENRETAHISSQSELKQDALEEYPADPCESDVKLNFPENGEFSPAVVQEETTIRTESINEKLTPSAEWSLQKEAELSELLMKMMETKPVKSRISAAPAGNKRQSMPSDQRGISYNQYKEKRDEKLRGEVGKKGAEKDKQFKMMQKILDAKKSQLASTKANDAGKKESIKKTQKEQKNIPEPANPKIKSPKAGIIKKVPSKPSSLPATRKSWPSMSAVKAPGPLPAKTPPATSQTSAVLVRRKSQPTQPVPRSSKIEKSQLQTKSVKSTPNDTNKSLGGATEKKQLPVTKPRKIAKSNGQTVPEDIASATKNSVPNKATKKSSVVPLESKPFLRKGSRAASNANPSVKKKVSPQEPLRKSEELTQVDETVKVPDSSDLVVQIEEREVGETQMEYETSVRSPQKLEDNEGFRQVERPADDAIDKVIQTELKPDDELESTISPTAWVEIEEHEDQPVTSGDHNCHQMAGLPAFAAPVGVSSPRVRHSLSQMLLEESSEPDVSDWGNAENPPQMVCHKDAPKGFKRLLKFGRKSKTDANSTGWSSPSVFSEGEDDAEDSKMFNKRSTENLLRKGSLYPKNNGHLKYSTDYEHSAQASMGKFDSPSLSQQIHEAHVSSSVITTKASRSFFSLSAFKGSSK